ncbi:MAG TPA: hypothetical protein VNJ11_15095 [Bryobacteraceae bacterium]|nr:hypothetical protein [Bryobacteraceae bacterium]
MTASAALAAAVLLPTALVAPLVYLEWRYASHYYAAFPYALFLTLWLLAAVSVLVAAPLLRTVRQGRAVLAHPVTSALRVALLALATVLWVALVADQWPCFMGAPGCD